MDELLCIGCGVKLQTDDETKEGFVDKNAFGAIFISNLTGFDFALNLVVTVILSISVVATIVSGVDYLKGSKELFKDSK